MSKRATRSITRKKPFRFLDLPSEIRLKVLWYTDLVVPADDVSTENIEINFDSSGKGYYIKQIKIHEMPANYTSRNDSDESEEGQESVEAGQIKEVERDEEAHKSEPDPNPIKGANFENEDSNHSMDTDGVRRFHIPSSLFRVCKLVTEESLFTLFSYNRFCLCCSPKQALRWLETIPRGLLKCIRKLDIVFSMPQVIPRLQDSYLGTDLPNYIRASLEMLLKFIATKFHLPKLFLSIDCRYGPSNTWPSISHEVISTISRQWWDKICKLVKEHLHNKMRRFQVYTRTDHAFEKGLEEMVMGPEFDSDELGKIPFALRDLKSPHKVRKVHLARHSGENARKVSRQYPEDDGKGRLMLPRALEKLRNNKALVGAT